MDGAIASRRQGDSPLKAALGKLEAVNRRGPHLGRIGSTAEID